MLALGQIQTKNIIYLFIKLIRVKLLYTRKLRNIRFTKKLISVHLYGEIKLIEIHIKSMYKHSVATLFVWKKDLFFYSARIAARNQTYRINPLG